MDTSALNPSPLRRCVMVCQHRSCARNGSADVLEALREAVPAGVFVSGTDCMGQCTSGPTVQVAPDGIWYCRMKPEDVTEFVEQHLENNQPVRRLLHTRIHQYQDVLT